MYQRLRSYLNISRREYRGMIVFLIILFLIYLSPYIYEKLNSQPLSIRVEVLKPIEDKINSFNPKKYNNDIPLAPTQLFDFDPNNLPLEDWIKLGLSQKQASIILKYQAKGGKFYKKEDLKRIYSISEKQYNALEPYIKIPKRESAYKKWDTNASIKKEKNIILVEINEADSVLLTSIKGIGPAFAARIIKYRNRLGGFYKKEQLKEVFGIDSTKYQQIEKQIIIETEKVRLIDVNNCTFEDLKQFPYLSYKQMNAIIAYRKQHGFYKSISDLNKIVILNPEVINRIEPYIKF